MALTVLISYDISENDSRAKAASRLQAWGERIQKSVFVVVIDPEDLKALCTKLTALMDLDHDVLHVVPLCAACREDVLVFGQATFEPPPLYWLV